MLGNIVKALGVAFGGAIPLALAMWGAYRIVRTIKDIIEMRYFSKKYSVSIYGNGKISGFKKFRNNLYYGKNWKYTDRNTM